MSARSAIAVAVAVAAVMAGSGPALAQETIAIKDARVVTVSGPTSRRARSSSRTASSPRWAPLPPSPPGRA
jgi:hypothetical protein